MEEKEESCCCPEGACAGLPKVRIANGEGKWVPLLDEDLPSHVVFRLEENLPEGNLSVLLHGLHHHDRILPNPYHTAYGFLLDGPEAKDLFAFDHPKAVKDLGNGKTEVDFDERTTFSSKEGERFLYTVEVTIPNLAQPEEANFLTFKVLKKEPRYYLDKVFSAFPSTPEK